MLNSYINLISELGVVVCVVGIEAKSTRFGTLQIHIYFFLKKVK